MTSCPKRLLAILAFPVVVFGSALLVALLSPRLGPLASSIAIGAAGAAIVALERFLPYRQAWKPTRRELLHDGLHVALALAVASGTQALVARFVPSSELAAKIPFVAAVALAVVLGDLAPYVLHRVSHERGGFLWALHAVHHTPTKLHFWNASRFHPLNVAANVALRAGSMRLLGFSELVVLVAATLGTVVNGFAHANADVVLGPLDWVFSGPALHREHHDRDLARGSSNYGGVVILWDLLLGTARPSRTTHDVGIVGAAPPERLLAQLLFPFRSCCARV
jgi:ornithine lipid hydroxylase